MVPAVAGDLVAGLGDAADQRGVALGDPAQSEEGRLDPGLVEQVEHRVGVALDAVRERLPLVAADHLLEGADLEPVLDIDGKGVEHRLSSALRPRACGRPSPDCHSRPSRPAGSGRGAASPPAPRARASSAAIRRSSARSRARRRDAGQLERRRRAGGDRQLDRRRAQRQHPLLARRGRGAVGRRHVGGDRLDRLGADQFALLDRGMEQQPVGELVDAGAECRRSGGGARRRRRASKSGRPCQPTTARRWRT